MKHTMNMNIERLRDTFLFQHISDFSRIRDNQTPHVLVITKDENDTENIAILPSLDVSDHVLI